MSGGLTTGNGRIARLRRYLEQDPGNRGLREELFDALLASGDFEAARREVDAVLATQPADVGWRHRQGVLHLATGAYGDAQRVFEALLAEGHDDPVVRYNLAYALFGQGKHGTARDLAAALLDVAGTAALAWPLWLRCQHHLDELEGSLQRVREADARGAVPAEALGVASIMAVDAQALDDARAWSDRALRERPSQLEALVARGTLALDAQDGAGARACFERGLEVSPGEGRCWSGLALARMMIIDLAGATQAFRKAVAVMPEHIGTWIAYGWCQLLMKDYPAALHMFQQALGRDASFGESHGAVAMALARLGRTDEAKREAEIALRLDPEGMSAQFALDCLAGKGDDPVVVTELARKVLERRPPPVASRGAVDP